MKRVRNPDEILPKNTAESTVESPNKKRRVDTQAANIHPTYTCTLNYELLDAFPNIFARCIEFHKDFQMVTRLAQVCKSLYHKVDEFLFHVSFFNQAAPIIAKYNALALFSTLASNSAIRNPLTIQHSAKNAITTLLDPLSDIEMQKNAITIAAHTIHSAGKLNIATKDFIPEDLVPLVKYAMDKLKKNPQTIADDKSILLFHGNVINLLYKLYDWQYIKLKDLDLTFLNTYNILDIVNDDAVSNPHKKSAALLYYALSMANLITEKPDDNEYINEDIIPAEMAQYPGSGLSIHAILSLEHYSLFNDDEYHFFSKSDLDFLVEHTKYEVDLPLESLETEEMESIIKTLCYMQFEHDKLRYAASQLLERYVTQVILPVLKDAVNSSNLIKSLILILIATVLIHETYWGCVGYIMGLIEKENAANPLKTIALEMQNAPDSSPYLQESISHILSRLD